MESITLSPARWIWAETNYIPNQWVSFRCKVEKPSAITEAPFYISVDTFDLAPFLRSGENQLEILVWHYGNGGRILSFHRRQDHPLSCISHSIAYLHLWEMGEDGLVKPRQDATRWYDHLFNVDNSILENKRHISG